MGSLVVGVHGIAQQHRGDELLHSMWWPALASGLRLAGHADVLSPAEFRCAFFGDLFRPEARYLSAGPGPESESEASEELLALWWAEAARLDPAVEPPDRRVLLRTPRSLQRGVLALSRSRFFAGLTPKLFISVLRQVSDYFGVPETRARAVASLSSLIDAETRVIVAHSLGSVVAYEALCAHPEWNIHTLVTIGSPLGIPNVIFDRLQPAPVAGRASWPGPVRSWTNLADEGDVVALVKDLRPGFGPDVTSVIVHNGSSAHSVQAYLTSREAGEAIGAGLGISR
ncbi:hypothetical protein ACFY36_13340 [Actinoplanes sp. NPDC000266]